MNDEQIDETHDIFQERTLTFDSQIWNRWFDASVDKIETRSLDNLAEVLRDLYRLTTDKTLSYGGRGASTCVVTRVSSRRPPLFAEAPFARCSTPDRKSHA